MASITAIEGIGPKYQKKLAAADIRTCEKLLDAGCTRKGRKKLADTCGLSDKRILEWVNRADLMRVNGVSTQYSDLLEAAGVDTVKELKRRKPANLHEAMVATNNRRKNKLVKQVPAVTQVERWVAHAKELPAVVKH
ncbi:MAG: DUF4332 domain-containing protein [Actinomycetota bacterium]|jgi:predicted flap endonuclease-1-like 5' DNA nuclease|nr:DUF4332 domain-containing protein [Actinomycetota bacterium]